MLRAILLWLIAGFMLFFPFLGVPVDKYQAVLRIIALESSMTRYIGPLSTEPEVAGDILPAGKDQFTLSYWVSTSGQLTINITANNPLKVTLYSTSGKEIAHTETKNKNQLHILAPLTAVGTHYLVMVPENTNVETKFQTSFTFDKEEK